MGKTHRSHKNAKGPTPQLRSRNTRSSKGRLLTETSSSTTQLTTQLSLLGLYAAATIGDGNCLFRALSDQLYGSPSKHHELRQQICDHIAKHKSRYEPFVEDERGLEAHLRAMRENATYGGHMELSAFAHMTKRNVKVIQPGLVYVIEWNAAGWEDGAGSTAVIAAGSSASSSEQAESSSTPRSISGRSAKPGSPTNAQEETRIKLGKGYYVYEEIGSEEEEDVVKIKIGEVGNALGSEGPTVYVAYHDWEHFSSIRNLRGPHTGLPDVVETPPQSIEDPEPQTAKEREKERDRERKKERERKEKERKEKERERKGRERKENENEPETGTSSGTLPKVKLKLSPSVSDANANLPVSVNVPSSTPAVSSRSGSQPPHDPSSIPLPISRSASPFVGPSSLVPSSTASPLPSSSLSNEVYPEDLSPNTHICTVEGLGHRHPHAHVLQTPRSQYRSPKRTFDESSASGGEEDPDNSKRSRRRRVESGGWSGAGADGTTDTSSVGKPVEDDVVKDETEEAVDIVMQVDVDGKSDEADTPSLSAPGSTSSSPLSSVAPSVASSVSGASSEVDADDDAELESQADDPDNENADKLPSSHTMPDGLSNKAHQKYLHAHPRRGNHSGDRPLTRRQRRALGLPKPRKGVTGDIHGSNGSPASLSAGKIVIPGGKWRGKGDSAEQTLAGLVADSQGDGEWRRNGSGRLDVRGFRELKI